MAIALLVAACSGGDERGSGSPSGGQPGTARNGSTNVERSAGRADRCRRSLPAVVAAGGSEAGGRHDGSDISSADLVDGVPGGGHGRRYADRRNGICGGRARAVWAVRGGGLGRWVQLRRFRCVDRGSGTDEFIVWSDAAGEVEKILYRARYPHDTLTNLSTGRSIVVRGEFQETIVPRPEHRRLHQDHHGLPVSRERTGAGVTVRDVGRITYGDLEQTIVLWEAGHHDLALDAQIEASFCGALA